jgi:phosphoglycolate phosphatase-like HAD superfamily hydrolase
VFELIVASDISDPPLNKAGLVRRIMMDKGLEPSRTVLVGDTKGDWGAANENGVRFILAGFGYGDLHPDEVRDKRIDVISSFEELVPALDRGPST